MPVKGHLHMDAGAVRAVSFMHLTGTDLFACHVLKVLVSASADTDALEQHIMKPFRFAQHSVAVGFQSAIACVHNWGQLDICVAVALHVKPVGAFRSWHDTG